MTDDEKVELHAALSEVVIEQLLLRNPAQDARDFRERCSGIGLILGRLMAAVVHEGDLNPRYLEFSRECELKGLTMMGGAQSVAIKAALKLVPGGNDG